MTIIRILCAAALLFATNLAIADETARIPAPNEAVAINELRSIGADIELNDQGHAIRLEWLSGTDHRFDNNDLKRASTLPQLKELWLDGADVSDSGLIVLNSMAQLETLALICKYETAKPAKITNDGVAHLKRLTGLRVLRLDDSDVTDAGLIHLSGLTKLEELDLFGTEISGAGLVHLRELKNLRYLNVSETQWETKGGAVTVEAAKALQKHLPRCYIAL